MNLLLLVIGLCFLVPAVGYAGLILWRWCAWTRVEAEVFRLGTNKNEVKATYVVGGRQRTAALGWSNRGVAVGDRAVVRYDPRRPFRHQVARPVWRTLCMLGLAVSAGCGAVIIAEAATGPRSDEVVDLPWSVSIVLGLLALAVGGWVASFQWTRRAWPTTAGTVTAVREQRSKDSQGHTSVTYQVTYRYDLATRADSRTATTDTFLRSHEKGQSVSVRYDPDDPDRSDLSTPRRRTAGWVSAVVLVVVGAVLVATGLADVVGPDAL